DAHGQAQQKARGNQYQTEDAEHQDGRAPVRLPIPAHGRRIAIVRFVVFVKLRSAVRATYRLLGKGPPARRTRGQVIRCGQRRYAVVRLPRDRLIAGERRRRFTGRRIHRRGGGVKEVGTGRTLDTLAQQGIGNPQRTGAGRTSDDGWHERLERSSSSLKGGL